MDCMVTILYGLRTTHTTPANFSETGCVSVSLIDRADAEAVATLTIDLWCSGRNRNSTAMHSPDTCVSFSLEVGKCDERLG